jgi:hypothetical protein
MLVTQVGDYFGTGECFVFTVAGRSGPGLLTTDIPRGPDVTVYRWVGPDDQASHLSRTHCDEEVVCTSTPLTPPPQVVNDMFAYATPEVLGFGSGGDGFALRLDETLEFGASRPCATYGNSASLFGGRDIFPVQRVQIWTFGTQF